MRYVARRRTAMLIRMEGGEGKRRVYSDVTQLYDALFHLA